MIDESRQKDSQPPNNPKPNQVKSVRVIFPIIEADPEHLEPPSLALQKDIIPKINKVEPKCIFLTNFIKEIEAKNLSGQAHLKQVINEVLQPSATNTRKKQKSSKKRTSKRQEMENTMKNLGEELKQKEQIFDELFFKNSKLKDEIFEHTEKIKTLEEDKLKMMDEIKLLNFKMMEYEKRPTDTESGSVTAQDEPNLFTETFGELEQEGQRVKNENTSSIGKLMSGKKESDLEEKMDLLKKELEELDNSMVLKSNQSNSKVEGGLDQKNEDLGDEGSQKEGSEGVQDAEKGKEGNDDKDEGEKLKLQTKIDNIFKYVMDLKEQGKKEEKVESLLTNLDRIMDAEENLEIIADKELDLYSNSEVSINSDNEDEIYSKDVLTENLNFQVKKVGNKELTQTAKKLTERYSRMIERIKDLKKMKEMYRDMYIEKLSQFNTQNTIGAEPEFLPFIEQNPVYIYYNSEIAQLKELGEFMSQKISGNLEKNLKRKNSVKEKDENPSFMPNQSNLSFAMSNVNPPSDNLTVDPSNPQNLTSNMRHISKEIPSLRIPLKKASSVKFINFLLSSIKDAGKNEHSKGNGPIIITTRKPVTSSRRNQSNRRVQGHDGRR